MAMPPPAAPGMGLDAVDTPALVVDLDAFEHNLVRMAESAAAFGVRLRPHAKTHKSPEIALRQIALGAVGACCQKTSEAEILIDCGVGDVLVSNQVVGQPKLDRLAGLAHRACLGVCVDDAKNAGDISAAAVRAGSKINVLVEIDVGAGRCGVTPGEDAVRLALEVAAMPGLHFAGLQAYQGAAQHLREPDERREAIGRAGELARQTVALLADQGLDCETVAGAGTGTYEIEATSGIWNELQAGSYIFMDADYARNRGEDGLAISTFEHALFVLATVMSYPASDRAVIDAGLKALAFDSGPPEVHQRAGISFAGASDEHGTLMLDGSNVGFALGDKLLLVPGHCDPTVNLHDWYVGVRGLGTVEVHVEEVWPVAARGAMF